MKTHLAALDQGTTSTRFIIFDHTGTPVATAQKEHRQICPRPGWVEHDPQEILDNSLEVTGMALDRAGMQAADLAAIGLANQRETTVLWERSTGRPLHNALVWQDTRVERLVAAFSREGGRDRFQQRTGLPLASYFSSLKLNWLLANVPGARAKAENGEALFGTIDAWLAWQLTGGPAGGRHITDVTNASRTQLMNIHTCEWDEEMLRAFSIPRACLPAIVPSAAPHGEITRGPARGVLLAGMVGDQQAALAGQACFQPGEAKNTYGTGSFLLLHTGASPVISTAGLLTTLACQRAGEPPQYALEGAIAVTGALVQWLRDNLRFFDAAPEIEALAASVPDNGGVYIVPAFSGLFAPYWRQDARGVITGLTGFATRAHLARAALEAAAYQVRDVVEAMRADSGIALASLRVDGGMANNNLLMQFQADILNAPICRPKNTESTALGAAHAAGLACGYWSGVEELRAHCQTDRTWQPVMDESTRARLLQDWRKAVSRSLDWVEQPEGAGAAAAQKATAEP